MMREGGENRNPNLVEVRNQMQLDREAVVQSTNAIWQHYESKNNDMRVTWIGHATVLCQMSGINVITDPIWSERCSPSQWFGPKRFIPAPFSLEELPPIHCVLISHNHYDHLDEKTVKLLGNSPSYYVPLAVGKYLENMGIQNYIEMDWWQETDIQVQGQSEGEKAGFRIICTPAQHWSNRTMFDKFKSLWCSWTVVNEKTGQKFFFGGDTQYCPIFDVIGEVCGPFDFAAIPIGAYDPNWFMKDSHCNPEEALFIHRDIRSMQSLAIHWGTFPLSAEAWNQPVLDLGKAKRKHGFKSTEFVGCRQGETFLIPFRQHSKTGYSFSSADNKEEELNAPYGTEGEAGSVTQFSAFLEESEEGDVKRDDNDDEISQNRVA